MYEEAIADLDLAVAMDPEAAGAYYIRATAKERVGRKKEAEEDRVRAARLFSGLLNMDI